jgi:hypothetical protein
MSRRTVSQYANCCLEMSRQTVSQYTNCLLPEDVKTDSVTVHKLSSAWSCQDRQCNSTQTILCLKMSRQTVSQYTNCLLPEVVKTDSVTIHKLSYAWRCQDRQCHSTQTVKRSFLRNHMLVGHNFMLTPVPVAVLKACHNSTAVASVLQTLWSIPRGHCSRVHLFTKPQLRLYCELFNDAIQLGTVSFC